MSTTGYGRRSGVEAQFIVPPISDKVFSNARL